MQRRLTNPPMRSSFDEVYKQIAWCGGTPTLRTTGGVASVAEAGRAGDGRRFISLPHSNRIYEGDWGYMTNSMGRDGQRIGHYSVPIDEWAAKQSKQQLCKHTRGSPVEAAI